jgi:hypothetical protein
MTPAGHAVAYWLKHCATSWKVACSRPDEMNEFFQFTYAPGAPLGLWFTHPLTETSTRNRKIMLLRSRALPVLKADKFTAIYEPIVQTMWDPQHPVTL